MTKLTPSLTAARLLSGAACFLVTLNALPLRAQEVSPAATTPLAPATPAAPAEPSNAPAPATAPTAPETAPATIEAAPPKTAPLEPILAEAPANEPSQAASKTSSSNASQAHTGGNSGKISFSSCNVEGKEIAITFDDGPHKTNTPQLLDTLKQRGIRATFFVVGQNATEYPDILKRIVAEGHELANHSYTHPVLASMSPSAVHEQLEKTHQAVLSATGVSMKLLRPPYGAFSEPQRRTAHGEFGYKTIIWSVDPLDWKHRDATRVQSEILSHTQAGAIVLAHDIHKSTVDAMPDTLDKLTEKGFKFVTVSELLALDRSPAQKTSADPANTPAAPAKSNSQPKKSEEKKTTSSSKSLKPATPSATPPAASPAPTPKPAAPKPAAQTEKNTEKTASTPASTAKKPTQLSDEEIKKKWLESLKR
jgi:peptidoglycan/xylan/chitin deacetylase (PgdA/CDA1 family)